MYATLALLLIMDIWSALIGAVVMGLLFLLKHFVVRSTNRTDKQEAIRETNNAHELEADESFRESLIRRVEVLEGKIDKLNTEVNEQVKENATIKAENAGLKKDNARLEREIEDLRKHRRSSDSLITALRAELDILKARVAQGEIGTAEQPLHVTVDNEVGGGN
jgi:chromosome segregation ATPase